MDPDFKIHGQSDRRKTRETVCVVHFVRDKKTDMWISTRGIRKRTNAEGKQFDRNRVTGEISRIEAISLRDVCVKRRPAGAGGGRGNRNRISNLLPGVIESTGGVKCVVAIGTECQAVVASS